MAGGAWEFVEHIIPQDFTAILEEVTNKRQDFLLLQDAGQGYLGMKEKADLWKLENVGEYLSFRAFNSQLRYLFKASSAYVRVEASVLVFLSAVTCQNR